MTHHNTASESSNTHCKAIKLGRNAARALTTRKTSFCSKFLEMYSIKRWYPSV